MTRLMLMVAIVSFGALCEPARADEIKLNGHTFTLPAGFTIELVAGPPLATDAGPSGPGE